MKRTYSKITILAISVAVIATGIFIFQPKEPEVAYNCRADEFAIE